jgi:hypothetical protein
MLALSGCQMKREVFYNREARFVVFLFLPVVVVFSLAVGNFGTGLRHRAKFIALLAALFPPRVFGFDLYPKRS